MLRGNWVLSFRTLAWVLLLLVLVPPVLPVFEAADSDFSTGIFDDDDDNDDTAAITLLPGLDLKPLAATTSPPPDLPLPVGGLVASQPDRPAPVVAVLPISSRSPPL